MNFYLNRFLFLNLILTSICFSQSEITVPSNRESVYVYSNKVALSWQGESQRLNSKPAQGLYNNDIRIIQDYLLTNGNTVQKREKAKEIKLFPNRLMRRYENFTENHYFVDQLGAFWINIESDTPKDLQFSPIWDASLEQLNWAWQPSVQMAVAQDSLLTNVPFFIGVIAWGNFSDIEVEMTDFKLSSTKRKSPDLNLQRLSKLKVNQATSVNFAIIMASDPAELLSIATELKTNKKPLLKQRNDRFLKLATQSSFSSDNPKIDLAYNWALFALDELKHPKEAFLGIAPLTKLSAREAFTNFPGMFLVQGEFERAKKLLKAFSQVQSQDKSSPFFGRIPLYFTSPADRFSPADVTPLFVKACAQYVHYSGDVDFINEVFPTIKKAIEGIQNHALDEYGFLVHGDDDTWMSTSNTDFNPVHRGNRAIEVQILWMEMLNTAKEWAELLGFQKWKRNWELGFLQSKSNFTRKFWNSEKSQFVDFLPAIKRPNYQNRGNQLSVLSTDLNLISETQKKEALQNLWRDLVYPWGVASLAQSDDKFHPYSNFPPYYSPEAARHNGVISLWQTNHLVKATLPYNRQKAFDLLENTAEQLLDKSPVGSLPAQLDAWKQKETGIIKFSDLPLYGQSLAAFIQNWREDILGLNPQLDLGIISLSPNLPASLKNVKFTVPLNNFQLSGSYHQVDGKFILRLNQQRLPKPIQLNCLIPLGKSRIHFSYQWDGKSAVAIQIASSGTKYSIKANGKGITNYTTTPLELLSLKFANPKMDFNIPVLKKPEFAVITPDEATVKRGRLTPVLFDIKDPKKDDGGDNGNYTYPENPLFKKGIFDIRRARIWRDDAFLYFELDFADLIPGNANSFTGYQQTFTAITLHFEKMIGVRRSKIEMNANFSVPVEYAYNFVVYLGNGYRITDARGKIVAEYRPTNDKFLLANAKKNKIKFSIPLKYLSIKHLRNAVILSGGEDSNTGEGLGVFRDVLKYSTKWHGGGAGKRSSNIYDVLYLRQ